MELINTAPLKYLLKCVRYRSLSLSERQHCFDALNSAGDTTLSQFVSVDGIIDGAKLASLRAQQIKQEISAEYATFRDINAASELILRLCNSTYLEPLIVARYLKRHEEIFGTVTDASNDAVVEALSSRALSQFSSERATIIRCQMVIYSWPTSVTHLAPLSRMFAAYTDFLQEKHPDLCELCAQSIDRLIARFETNNFAALFSSNRDIAKHPLSPPVAAARDVSNLSKFLTFASAELFNMLKLLLATLQRFTYSQNAITNIMNVVRRVLLWIGNVEGNTAAERTRTGRSDGYAPNGVGKYHTLWSVSFRHIRACCALIVMSVVEAYFDISSYMDVISVGDEFFQPALFYWAALRTGSATPATTHTSEADVIAKTFRSGMLMSFNNLFEDDPDFLEDYLRQSVREKLYMPFLTAVLSRNYWRCYMHSFNFRCALSELVHNCLSLPSCAAHFWEGLLLDQTSQPIAFIEYGNWLHMHPVASQLQYSAISGLLRSIGGIDAADAPKALAMLEQHIWALKYVTVEAGEDLFTRGVAQRRQRQMVGQHQLLQIVLRDNLVVAGVDGLVIPAGSAGIVLGDLSKGFADDDDEDVDCENDDYSVNNGVNDNVFLKFSLQSSSGDVGNEFQADNSRIDDENNSIWRSVLSCIKTFREYVLNAKPSLNELSSSDIGVKMISVARLLSAFVKGCSELSSGVVMTDAAGNDATRRYLSRIVAVTEEYHTAFQVLLALVEAKQTSDFIPLNVAELLQLSMRMTFELARVRFTRYDFDKLLQILPRFGAGGFVMDGGSFAGFDAVHNLSGDAQLFFTDSSNTSMPSMGVTAESYTLSNVSKWWRVLVNSCMSANVDERIKRRLFKCVDVPLELLLPIDDSHSSAAAASSLPMDTAFNIQQRASSKVWLEKAPPAFYNALRSSALFIMKLFAPPVFAAARGRAVEVRMLKLLLFCLQTSSEAAEETDSLADDFRSWLCGTVNMMLVEGTAGVSIIDLMRNLSYEIRATTFHVERQTLGFIAMLIIHNVVGHINESRKNDVAASSLASAAVDGGGGEPVGSLQTLFERELFANAGPSLNYSPINDFAASYAPNRILLQRNAEANLCALARYATLSNADNQSRIVPLNTLSLIVDKYRFSLTGCLGDNVANELRYFIMDQIMPFASHPSKPVATDESSSLISLNVENAELVNACLRLLSHSMPNHLTFVESYLNCVYERLANPPTTLVGLTSPKLPLSEADFFTRKKVGDAVSLLDVLISLISDDSNFAAKVSNGDGCRSVQRAAFNMLTTLWSKQYYVAIDYIMQYHSTQLFAAIRRLIEQACSEWFEGSASGNNYESGTDGAEQGMATEGADFLLKARLDTLTGVLRLLAAQLMLQEWQTSSRMNGAGVIENQRKTDKQWEENVWNVLLKTTNVANAETSLAAPPLFDELAKVVLIKIPTLLNRRKQGADNADPEDLMDVGVENDTKESADESSDYQLSFCATDTAFAWRNFMLLYMAASDKLSPLDSVQSAPPLSSSRTTLHAVNSELLSGSNILSTPISPVRIQKLIVRLLAAMQKWFSEPNFVSDSYKAAVMGFAKQVFLRHCQFFSTFALTALARLHSIVHLVCGAEGLTLHTDFARSVILSMIEPIFDSLSASPAALVIVGTDAGRSAPPAIAAAVSSSAISRRRAASLYPNLATLIEDINDDNADVVTANNSNTRTGDAVVDDGTSFIAERLLLSVLSSLLDYFDSALRRWASFGIDSSEILSSKDVSNGGGDVVDHDAFEALKQVLDIIYHVVRCMRAINPTQFEGTFFNNNDFSDAVTAQYQYEYANDAYDEEEETAGVVSGRPPLLGQQQRSPHIVTTTTTPRRVLKSIRAASIASESVIVDANASPYDKYRWERIVMHRATVSKCVSIAETCMKCVKYPKFVNSLLKLMYTMSTEEGGRPNTTVCGSMHACDLISRLGWALTTAFRPEFDHRLSAHWATWTENLTILCDIMHACLLERRRSALAEADIVDFFASLNWRTSIVRLYSAVDCNKWNLPATPWQQRVSGTLSACIRLMGAVYQNVFVEYASFYENHTRIGGFSKRFFTDLTPPKQLVLDGFMRLSSHVLNSVAYALLSTNFGRSRRHHKRTPSTTGESGNPVRARSSGGSEVRSLSRGAAAARRKEAAAAKDAAVDASKQPLQSAVRRNPGTLPHQHQHTHATGRNPDYIKRVLIASKPQFQLCVTILQAMNAMLPELDELILAKPLSKLPFLQYFLLPSFSLPSFTTSLSGGDGNTRLDAVHQPLLSKFGRTNANSNVQLHAATVASNIGFAREFDLSYGTLLSLCSSCIDYMKEVMRLLTEDTATEQDNNAADVTTNNASKIFMLTKHEQSQLAELQKVINETLDSALLVTIKHGLLHLRIAVDNSFAVQVCGGNDEKLDAAGRAAAFASASSASATSATVCTELHQELKSIVRQLDRHSAHNLSGLQDSSSSQSQSHSQEDLSSLSVLGGGGADSSPGASGLRKFGGSGGGLSRDVSVILPCTIPHTLKEAETLRDLLLYIIVYVKPFKFSDRQIAMLLNAGGRKSSTSSQPRPATLVGLGGGTAWGPQSQQHFSSLSASNTQYATAYSSPYTTTSMSPTLTNASPGWSQQKPYAPNVSSRSPAISNSSNLPLSSAQLRVSVANGLQPTTIYGNTRNQPPVNPAPPRSPVWGFGGLFR